MLTVRGIFSEDVTQNKHGHERGEGRADGHDRTHDQFEGLEGVHVERYWINNRRGTCPAPRTE